MEDKLSIIDSSTLTSLANTCRKITHTNEEIYIKDIPELLEKKLLDEDKEIITDKGWSLTA